MAYTAPKECPVKTRVSLVVGAILWGAFVAVLLAALGIGDAQPAIPMVVGFAVTVALGLALAIRDPNA